MNKQAYPLAIKIYALTMTIYIFTEKKFQKLGGLIKACLVGFWLGILRNETIYLVNKRYYDKKKMFHEEEYNKSGLFKWEKEAINKYFKECKTLLVEGAGGGREVLALCHLGYDTDGFESNPDLINRANELHINEGFGPKIQHVLPDKYPDSIKMYDGVIVGWTVYSHIHGSKQRIEFLKKLRSHMREKSPVLLSFYSRVSVSRYLKVTAIVGNVIRGIMRRERLEIGDDLFNLEDFSTIYAHIFAKKEIAIELREGGFDLEFYSTDGVPYAVGIASKQSDKILT